MSRILLVTGEASGDLHGANLAKAFKFLDPGIEIWGAGGEKMLAAGVQLVPQLNRVDAIGVPGLRQVFLGWRNLKTLSAYLDGEPFDAIVLIDSPGLNLRLAKSAQHLSGRIYYYIAPQMWAWGGGRINLLRRVVRRVLAVLPFEEAFFQKAGIPCTFVGHPLMDDMEPSYDKSHEREVLGFEEGDFVLGLFPGSRRGEIRKILPVLLKSLPLLKGRFASLQVVLAQAHSLPDSLIQDMLKESVIPVRVIKEHPYRVMAMSDCLLMASGTATLQAALVGTPMVIVYRVNILTYLIAKLLVTINFIGLVNILAGREVAPELIQGRMTPDNITREVVHLVTHPDRIAQMRKVFDEIRLTLGGPGASLRAAEIILTELRH